MTTKKQTPAEALRGDSCSFPSYTIAMHKVAADHIDALEAELAALREQLDTADSENHQAWNILHAVFAVLPATSEEYHIIREFIEGTWRQE